MREKQFSPLKGKYWVRNPLGNFFLRVVDFIVQFFPHRSRTVQNPKKILISNLGHLGDVVIATCVIPALKKTYPKAQLGFLVGSWSRSVIAQHRDVDFIHTLDHWKLNRSSKSKLSKYFQYRKTRRQCLKELRSVAYDVAIDLYFFYPNAISLLWQAQIPCRIGYMSGGYGPLLTTSRTWEISDRYMGCYHFDLLKQISVDLGSEKDLRPFIPTSSQSSVSPLKKLGIASGYYVFHMGTGSPFKKWGVKQWTSLARAMEKRGEKLVFTGDGKEEKKEVEQVIGVLGNSVDLCSKLSWQEFAEVIQRAQMLISCDSVASHVACGYDVPTIVIGSGVTLSSLWFYPTKKRAFIMNSIHSLPYFKKHGYAEMSCIRNISIDHILKTIGEIDELSSNAGMK